MSYNPQTGLTYIPTIHLSIEFSDAGIGISAPPITYDVDGKQYVALLVGWGGGASGLGGDTQVQNGWAYGVHTRRLVAFSLDGRAE